MLVCLWCCVCSFQQTGVLKSIRSASRTTHAENHSGVSSSRSRPSMMQYNTHTPHLLLFILLLLIPTRPTQRRSEATCLGHGSHTSRGQTSLYGLLPCCDVATCRKRFSIFAKGLNKCLGFMWYSVFLILFLKLNAVNSMKLFLYSMLSFLKKVS